MTSTGPKLPRNSRKRPVILVDRCLGWKIVDALKRYGVNAYHLGDIYPDDGAAVADVTWLEDAGQRGYLVLTLDSRVRHNSLEWETLLSNNTRVFTLTKRDPTEALKGLVVGRQLPNIIRRGNRPGPCFWRVQGETVTRIVA